jgi:peptide/nickel transport system ATP-binding protein
MFRSAPCSIVGLVGESGGGKTMIGKTVLGVLPPGGWVTSGSIRFDGQDLLSMNGRQRRGLRGRSMTMILQNPMTALNPVFRIEDQMIDVMQLHLGLSAGEARSRALEMLSAVRIRDPERVMRLYPHELSGGMCQRVVISIAFSCEPKLIIADEPTTALDVTVQHQILKLIKLMQAKTGASVLFVTHDLGVVAKICDSVTILYAGMVLERGSAADIFNTPHHDYTRALLAAAPRYDRPLMALQSVPQALRDRLQADAQAYDRQAGHA